MDIHRVEFGVLGPLLVRINDKAVPIRAAKQRALLAALVLHAGQTVGVTSLSEVLWDDRPPLGARAAVQAHVTRLRRVLRQGHDGGRPALIRTTSCGYLLAVPPESVDAMRFTELCRQADAIAAGGDLHTASRQFAEALGLWRGSPLADTESDALCRVEIPGLCEQRLLAIERRAEIDLALGRYRLVIAELRALVTEYPLRERYWYLYMLALHRCGWRAEALAAYRHARQSLIEELGVEPGEELRELHQAMLAGKEAGLPRVERLTRGRPGPRTTRARLPRAPRRAAHERPNYWIGPCQLPPDVGDFVGRVEEMDLLVTVLTVGEAAMPVLVLCGAPGVGKTALAVRVAHRVRDAFPDGQLYVRLADEGGRPRDPADILAEEMLATGLARCSIPGGLDQRAAAFRAWFADRRVLVVLDDALSAAQVRTLLPGTGGCAVLVTSRGDLRGLIALQGARRHVLGVLPPAESLTLLERLIGHERVAAEPETAADIASLCGRLPLALRIAAANLASDPLLPLASYAAELRKGDLLAKLAVAGDPAAAVGAAFDVCYRALDPSLRQVFQILGSMPAAGLTVSAVASQLGTDDASAARLLDRLAASSLIYSHVPGGFCVPDLLRIYAVQRARLAPLA